MKIYSELNEDQLPAIKYNREELVARIKETLSTHPDEPRLALLADIDHLKAFFDEYGREQRLVVLGNVHEYLRTLQKGREVGLIDRLAIDQFFLLAPVKEGLAERIRQHIGQMTFPKFDVKSEPVPLEDGVTVDPEHVTVHIGQIGFIPNQSLDYRALIDRLYELTRGTSAGQINRKDWTDYH
ncbi:diguanylate cyclase [Candidatus Woesearchaeota archaeon]|nr:diguanylate cyclase [Candidatus Woesearchaeota archaeon]